MKHTLLTLTAVTITSLTLGFAIGQVSTTQPAASPPRVTGIGGVFFKAKDPATLKAWYSKNLGLPMDKYGTMFQWRESDAPDGSKGPKGSTQWAAFNEKTKYFAPSEKQFMINYRVANLPWLLEQLKKEGIEPVGPILNESYGSFAHIMDPEGNKIELWEPKDAEAEKAK